MKKSLSIAAIILLTLMLTAAPLNTAGAAPSVTVTLLNPPPDGVLTLGVGESYTFDIQITSDVPFNFAKAIANTYYPGKAVFWQPNSDKSSQGTSALVHITVVGKKSTAGLPQVCDWPTAGMCWAAGSAPQAIQAGVRFKGGGMFGEIFPFTIIVP